MILILEIILTIVTWQKGWRGWALIPMGFVLIAAFLIGLAVGAAGGTEKDIIGPCLILDLLGVVSLIVMIMNTPNREKSNEHIELPEEEAIAES